MGGVDIIFQYSFTEEISLLYRARSSRTPSPRLTTPPPPTLRSSALSVFNGTDDFSFPPNERTNELTQLDYWGWGKLGNLGIGHGHMHTRDGWIYGKKEGSAN